MDESNYLELRTESEAVARGANLSEKIPYAVFQAIRACSHTDQVRTGSVFHIGSPIAQLGTLDYRRGELKEVLEELMKEKLIVQLFYLRFDPTSHSIRLIPCYVARPEGDRITTEQLYRELLMESVSSIEEFIKSAPGLDKDRMWKDLEKDFQSHKMPEPSQLPETIFDPLHSLDAASFDFIPPAELIKHAREAIKEELLRRKRILQIVEYGWMPLRQEEIIRRFEIAQEFMNTRLPGAHRSNSSLQSDLRSIQSAEENYYLDAGARKSAEFGFKKASAFKKHLMTGVDRKNRIPGSLAIEIVLGLYSDTEKAYQELRQRDIDREYRELRNSIAGPEAPLVDRLQFFEEPDLEEISPEVWRKLISSVDLLHSAYEKSDGTCNVLAKNDAGQFPAFVQLLLTVEPEQHWKILAFRELIEKHETALQNLFYDLEFMDNYSQLLKKAYWTRMPWYFRVLLFLGVKSVVESAFEKARHRIAEEQSTLAARNQQRRDTRDRHRIIQIKEKTAELQSQEAVRRIIETVERWVQEKGIPPLQSELIQELPDGGRVESLIDNHGFRTIEHGQSRIVLFPVDFNWRKRTARMRRSLNKWLEEGSLPSEYNERVRLVLRSLTGSSSGGSAQIQSGREPALQSSSGR